MQPTEGQKKEKATAFIWSFMEAFCINPTNSCTNSILLLAQLCTLSRFQVKRGNIWFQFPLPSALPSFGNLKGCLFINRDLTAPKTSSDWFIGASKIVRWAVQHDYLKCTSTQEHPADYSYTQQTNQEHQESFQCWSMRWPAITVLI
jgi:hypothetical protein